jgi:hypothetical protein
MALTKCKECGNQISQKAESCPNCGAPVKRQSIGCASAIGVILLLVFAGSMLRESLAPSPSTKESSAPTKSNPITEAPTKTEISQPKEPKSDWYYDSRIDKMSEKKTSYAILTSEDSTYFDFPYKRTGGSYLSIVFRKGPDGFDAYLKIDEGQMLCSYSDCKFRLKIGDQEPQTWTGLRSTTHNSDLMFIRDARQFEKIVKSGNPLKIGINFHRAGERVFTFKTEAYKPL